MRRIMKGATESYTQVIVTDREIPVLLTIPSVHLKTAVHSVWIQMVGVSPGLKTAGGGMTSSPL